MKLWLKHVLPKSKKARNLLALFVFASLILTALFFIKKPTSSIQVIDNAIQNTANIGIATKDSDEDGLKDWEEVIFKTDPNKKDTDGDGTDDKEEIANGRDPLKPGPDDILPKTTEIEKTSNYEENLTREFTESFLFDPITKITTGQRPEINTLSIGAYAEELLKNPVLSSATKIGVPQIKASTDKSSQAIQNYSMAFGDIVAELNLRGENETDITVNVLKNQQYDELKKLDKHVEYYRRTIERLLQVSVPPLLVNFHMEVVNYLFKFKLATELMRNMEADPLKALLAIKERLNLEEEYINFLTKEGQRLLKILEKK